MVEAEQLVLIGPHAKLFQVLRIRLLLYDDGHVLECMPELIWQTLDRVSNELLKGTTVQVTVRLGLGEF